MNQPVVEFGEEVGGTALYPKRSYRFGVYAGDNRGIVGPEVRIKVFDGSDQFQGTISIDIPSPIDGSEWNDFQNAGYTTGAITSDVDDYNLRTAVSYVSQGTEWGLSPDFDYGAFILTYFAQNDGYRYEIEVKGRAPDGNGGVIAVAETESLEGERVHDFSPLYSIDFSDRPAWTIDLLKPTFRGEALPPFYHGKSVAELLAEQAEIPRLLATDDDDQSFEIEIGDGKSRVGLNHSSLKALDNSPELRTHTILDEFVADNSGDPIALVNYVYHEIELTNALGYDQQGRNQSVSVYPLGVQRSAFATFQEGQGNPYEQCALLVYLLRKAGYAAAYVGANHGKLKMLDTRVSNLLRLNVSDPFVQRLIPVNYPWVVAYIDGEWRHLFPWLADVEVSEGFDLSAWFANSLLPGAFTNGTNWVKRYLEADPSILGVDNSSDQVSRLFPRFVEANLLATPANASITGPGRTVSMDDFGIFAQQRKHYFSDWDDFPRPFSITEELNPILDLSEIPGVFDTLRVEVFPVDPNPLVPVSDVKLDTGSMLVSDLHNRQMLVFFRQHFASGNLQDDVHQAYLGIDNFDFFAAEAENWPVQNLFTVSDPFIEDSSSVKLTHLGNITVGDIEANQPNRDPLLRIQLTRQTQRLYPLSSAPEPTGTFWNIVNTSGGQLLDDLDVVSIRDIQRGDVASININTGRVTDRMVDYHGEKIARRERAKEAGEALDEEDSTLTLFGNTLYYLGAAYWREIDEFDAYNRDLHKIHSVSNFGYLFPMLRPERDENGLFLNNGELKYNTPSLELFEHYGSRIFNGTVQLTSGVDSASASRLFAPKVAIIQLHSMKLLKPSFLKLRHILLSA